MPKLYNELGKIFNHLKVIDKDISKNGRVFWKCECQICKTIYSISGTDLRNPKKNIDCSQCEKVGEKFGKLTVIALDYVAEDRHKYWKCQCECGNIESIRATDLNNNKKNQCYICNKQNKNNQYIDETGNIYGYLTVIEYDKEKSKKIAWWKCKCKCGNIISVPGIKLRNYHTSSCGCMKSRGEFRINQLLTQANIQYISQFKFKDCQDKDLLKFDFAIFDENNNLQYLIEYDGIQHFQETGWGNLQDIKKRDTIKNEYCRNNHIPLIRIPYTDYDIFTLKDLTLNSKYII